MNSGFRSAFSFRFPFWVIGLSIISYTSFSFIYFDIFEFWFSFRFIFWAVLVLVFVNETFKFPLTRTTLAAAAAACAALIAECWR